MRNLTLPIILGLCFALPGIAGAQVIGMDLTKGGRLLLDGTCTDLYDVPATTLDVDASDENNFDNPAEVLNLDLNLEDDTQTSGSPDGFCDATPWILKGSWVTATDESLYLGPIRHPTSALWVNPQWTSIGTNWSIDFAYWSLTTDALRSFMAMSDSTSTASLNLIYGPTQDVSSQVSASDQAPWPRAPIYIILDLNGAGTWTGTISTYPTSSAGAW